MRVRMAELAAGHQRSQQAIEGAVLEVLRSGRYVGGPAVDQAESQLADAFELAHGVGVASGTDALLLGLRALGVQPGWRVAVPALSFFATAEAVLWLGATPVVVDVLPDRPVMDPDAIPSDVQAAIIVPLFGAWAPPPRRELPLLCDAAQAIGWGHGKPPGQLATLSLYPTKTLGCAGDGGAVLTDDPELAARVRALGNHGLVGPHDHRSLGRNSRLDALQAAMVSAQLPDLPRRIQRRRQIAAAYDAALPSPLPRHPADAVHHYLLRSERREQLRAALDLAGIDSAVYYPFPLDAQPPISGLDRPQLSASRCPNAVAFCRTALALPCHAELSDEQVQRVCRVLGESA